jgi:hypothetical protein
MSVSSSVISFEHGKVLNQFIDCGELFVKEARDIGPAYSKVAAIIVESLLRRTELELTDPEHPFNKYATEHPHRNLRTLSNVLMDKVQGNHAERSAVVSYFHSGGANRDALDDLLEAYYEFADTVTEGSTIDGSEDGDEGSDAEEDAEYENNPNY